MLLLVALIRPELVKIIVTELLTVKVFDAPKVVNVAMPPLAVTVVVPLNDHEEPLPIVAVTLFVAVLMKLEYKSCIFIMGCTLKFAGLVNGAVG